ncbi:hypothetical protein IAD21_01782 [Abditibacteriota bacterium]|nr:hypothetical protein IAD21_01782 [Abditibacteriota bacterium]
MLSSKMQHQEFEPPDELRDTIKCFWYNRRDCGEHQSSFEVLPDGYAEIVFHFGSACSISTGGGLQSLPSPFMMGLLNQPILFNTKNRFEIIGIRCFPWTVFDLLGLPSGQDGVRIFEHPIAQLQSTLNQWIRADRVDEALSEVKQYLLDARSQIATDSRANA